MNLELILSFLLMRGLAPAGTSVPAEALLTSADAMPAWARFTFQTHVISKLEVGLNQCRAELEHLRGHHRQSHEANRAFEAEVKRLFALLHDRFGHDPRYHQAVGELIEDGQLPRLVELFTESQPPSG